MIPIQGAFTTDEATKVFLVCSRTVFTSTVTATTATLTATRVGDLVEAPGL